MWRNQSSLRSLSFLLLAVFLVASSVPCLAEDKKLMIYESELKELTQIIERLELSNKEKQKSLEAVLALLNQLQSNLTASLKSLEQKDVILQERENSWIEYKNAIAKEMKSLQAEKVLWQIGTFTATGVAVFAFIYSLIPR